MIKRCIGAAAVLTLSACTAIGLSGPRDGVARVNPASLAADPERWYGKQVEIVGLLVWEFENKGLYQSYGAYCRGAEKAAIFVQWDQWPGVTRKDSRRQVVVRGTFRPGPAGTLIVSNAAPGPGPLEPGMVMQWLSAPAKPCPRALP